MVPAKRATVTPARAATLIFLPIMVGGYLRDHDSEDAGVRVHATHAYMSHPQPVRGETSKDDRRTGGAEMTRKKENGVRWTGLIIMNTMGWSGAQAVSSLPTSRAVMMS